MSNIGRKFKLVHGPENNTFHSYLLQYGPTMMVRTTSGVLMVLFMQFSALKNCRENLGTAVHPNSTQ